jgi:hypothetical protein
MKGPRLRLHDYPASGNCYKVRLLLALLARPYERVPTDIFAGETLTEQFGRLNPARETPVLELESGEVILQSNAILWYLAEGTDFLPAEALSRARTVQWLHFEQERIVPGIGSARFYTLTGRNPALIDAGWPSAEARLTCWTLTWRIGRSSSATHPRSAISLSLRTRMSRPMLASSSILDPRFRAGSIALKPCPDSSTTTFDTRTMRSPAAAARYTTRAS